jgi:hypothetical protein
MLWVKCTTTAECKPIRIAESSVMEGWNGRYLAQCRFCFHKDVFKKMEKVPDGVLEGYYRGTGIVRSTCRVLPEEWGWSCVIDLFYKVRWSCLIDHRLSLEESMSSPFSRDFY